MKRLTPLAQKERAEHCAKLNLVAMVDNGFWQCKRCNLPRPVEERTDHDDDSRIYHVCAECGSHHVVWHAPAAQAPPRGVPEDQAKPNVTFSEHFQQLRRVLDATPTWRELHG